MFRYKYSSWWCLNRMKYIEFYPYCVFCEAFPIFSQLSKMLINYLHHYWKEKKSFCHFFRFHSSSRYKLKKPLGLATISKGREGVIVRTCIWRLGVAGRRGWWGRLTRPMPADSFALPLSECSRGTALTHSRKTRWGLSSRILPCTADILVSPWNKCYFYFREHKLLS
jgi:hypothetical protein